MKSILLFPCGLQQHNLFFLAPQGNTFYQSFHQLCAVPDFGLKGVSQKGGCWSKPFWSIPPKKHPEHPVKVLQDLHRVFQRQSRAQGQILAAATRARTTAHPNISPKQTNFFRSKTK